MEETINPNAEYVDVEGAMKLLGVKKSTVFYLVEKYQIEVFTGGPYGKHYYRTADIRAILDDRTAIKPVNRNNAA